MSVPSFGAWASRLAAHRKIELPDHEPELASAYAGGAPTDGLLRLLAPALGLDPSDLFVLAGRTVPDDLDPRHERVDRRIAIVVRLAIARPGLLELLTAFVASLPDGPSSAPS